MSKIKQITAYEQVFLYMKEAIKNKEWKVNEKIPSEIELSDRFGVNRLTVRMALQRLNGMGILETRVGDGTYVKKFSFKSYIENVTDFYTKPELLDKVCDFRLAIEVACARLAIMNASEQEVDELLRICNEYDALKMQIVERRSPEDFTKLVEKDVEFHHKLCEMSHNELFIYTFEVAREAICQYIMFVLNKRIESWDTRGVEPVAWNDMHRDVYLAVAAKDFDACRDAVLKMVDSSVEL